MKDTRGRIWCKLQGQDTQGSVVVRAQADRKKNLSEGLNIRV